MGECTNEGGGTRMLTWFYGGLDLASGGVGRLRHVNFPEGDWVENGRALQPSCLGLKQF